MIIWAYPKKMIKFSSIVSFLLLLTFTSQSRAQENALNCELIPVLMHYSLRAHYAIQSQTDELNQRTVDQMIKRLDPSKLLLLQSDVDELKPKLLNLLKNIRKKDCSDLDAIKDLLVKRTSEQLAFAKEYMNDKYKLDESVEYQLDPEKRNYAKDLAESHKNQIVQMHFQISNYLQTDMKLAKAKEQLIHRYELSVKRSEKIKKATMYDYFVNAFASALDPHSNYMGPLDTEDFRINMNLSLEGIGASLSSDDGYTVIQELIPGGAAAKSKQLQRLDKIIAVAQGDQPAENVIDMDLQDVVSKIRGKAGTKVKLTILREKPSVQRLEIVLTRSKVNLVDDAAKVEMYERKVNGKNIKLARIDLPGFYGGMPRSGVSSSDDMLKAVLKAKKEGAEGLLLDLSSNGGGLLDEAVKIAGLFIEKGNIVATRDSSGEVQMLDDIDSEVQFSGPVVVLISRLSASASEIVAGALQDYKRAIIVGGDHTYGKGSVQAVVPLQPEYGQLKITTGLFFIPGGNSTQHRGVTSDVSYPNPFSTDDIGEKYLDYSLKPDSIKTFLTPESNAHKLWTPVSIAEIEKLRILSQARVAKNKDFAEVLKDLKEAEEKKGLIKLADLRKKDGADKKKNKDKAAKEILKERNKPQMDEALNILADFVNLRKQGSSNLISNDTH